MEDTQTMDTVPVITDYFTEIFSYDQCEHDSRCMVALERGKVVTLSVDVTVEFGDDHTREVFEQFRDAMVSRYRVSYPFLVISICCSLIDKVPVSW